jgi:cytochrome P450
MHVLSTTPEVEACLHAEVAAAAATAGGVEKLTYVDLQRLTYLEAFIKELLRMYPSAGFTREVNAPLVLSESVTVPAGTDCYVFPYLVHRAPGNFSQPDTFDPQRWLAPLSPDDHQPACTYVRRLAVPRSQCTYSACGRRHGRANAAARALLSLASAPS